MPDRGRGDKSFWIRYGEYSQLAVALPAATFVGWAIGALIDRWLGTTWVQFVGIGVGSVAGLMQVVRFVNREKR
jgi:F0F1-type ATP synthase assembly protein I